MKLRIGIGVLAMAASMSGQIAYDSVPDLLKLPEHLYLGEAAGVATNSKGNIFVYTRTGGANSTRGASRIFTHGGSRLFEFDRNGKYVREIGEWCLRLPLRASRAGRSQRSHLGGRPRLQHGDRVRPGRPRRHDPRPQAGSRFRRGGRGGGEAWSQPGHWRPRRQLQPAHRCRLGCRRQHLRRRWLRQRADCEIQSRRRVSSNPGARAGRGRASSTRRCRSPRIRAATSTWRIAATSGFRSSTTRATFQRQIANVGAPWAICVSPGAHQYLYSSNSNETNSMDGGEIYRLELDGTVLGKFGTAGKQLKEFGTVNEIDCRNPNELLVGELTNWRVQRIRLRP